MKKVIVITNGQKLRAFRVSDQLHGTDLRFRYTEIRCADLRSPAAEPTETGLSRIADQVSQIMAEEEPLLWNLVAPQDLLDPLLRKLDGKIGQDPASAVEEDLVEASLPDIAVRFPPMPCRQWSPTGSPAKESRSHAAAVME